MRRQLQNQTQEFLSRGGGVQEIERGISGRDPQDNAAYLTERLFVGPREPRTLVPEVVAAIEARRSAMRKSKPRSKQPASRGPRRKVVYDDFGEPLRHIWVED